MKSAVIMLAATFVLLLAGGAHADLRPTPADGLEGCDSPKYFVAKTDHAPPLVAAIQKYMGDGVGIQLCTDAERNVHYFLRVVRPNADGVCRVFEREIFAGNPHDKINTDLEIATDRLSSPQFAMPGWRLWPPVGWLQRGYFSETTQRAKVTNAACGPDLKGYIVVRGISNGTLKAFVSFWQQARSSKESFQRTFLPIFGKDPEQPAMPAALAQRFDQANLQFLVDAALSPYAILPSSLSCGEYSHGACLATFGSFAVRFDMTSRGLIATGGWPLAIP